MVTPKSFTKIEHKGIYTLRTNPRKGPVLRTTNDRHARSSYIDKADVLSELRGELFCQGTKMKARRWPFQSGPPEFGSAVDRLAVDVAWQLYVGWHNAAVHTQPTLGI
jgi:hypothetical protein